MATFPRKKETRQFALSSESLLVIGLSVLGGDVFPSQRRPNYSLLHNQSDSHLQHCGHNMRAHAFLS
jgi:hypothetical protein